MRFVVGKDDEHHKSLTGIITEARLLRDAGRLESYEEEALSSTYRWFNDNLPCPPFSTSDWPQDAVSWFKDDAGEPVRRMWDIVALLKNHSVPVRVLRSKSPGRILYEDEYQVVVVEWSSKETVT
ncbi:MAG: hypothetical protein ACYSU0_04955 [Planctomycetota bacterium]